MKLASTPQHPDEGDKESGACGPQLRRAGSLTDPGTSRLAGASSAGVDIDVEMDPPPDPPAAPTAAPPLDNVNGVNGIQEVNPGQPQPEAAPPPVIRRRAPIACRRFVWCLAQQLPGSLCRFS
ncbi:uncharacterized protein THITE_2111636 [Thermothielavioides terrestris NRRL 8126]|uniref:Uncharacterized protein n=1 Tax=Thermothielavioides terrestris (strain ATCC 38088 / NRRL 8126) TaxID=578455 RepID=G2R355_THETT|nr:uncharacterized protein THITE_2111636 [Thermothielavioides terrestris NRRL 8126]AEO65061.1 hypothetical protein THITE_2111636 [Thermothielavioides terrestris NRRL 8126]